MPRRVDVVLHEILLAIDQVCEALAPETEQSFATHWVLQRAAERGIEIISEAVRHLPQELLSSRPDLPWREIKAVGNFIRHEYHRVEPRIIWSVVVHDLPALRQAAERFLKQIDAGHPRS
jgi:uncharacterized protein with HEPN domain